MEDNGNIVSKIISSFLNGKLKNQQIIRIVTKTLAVVALVSGVAGCAEVQLHNNINNVSSELPTSASPIKLETPTLLDLAIPTPFVSPTAKYTLTNIPSPVAGVPTRTMEVTPERAEVTATPEAEVVPVKLCESASNYKNCKIDDVNDPGILAYLREKDKDIVFDEKTMDTIVPSVTYRDFPSGRAYLLRLNTENRKKRNFSWAGYGVMENGSALAVLRFINPPDDNHSDSFIRYIKFIVYQPDTSGVRMNKLQILSIDSDLQILMPPANILYDEPRIKQSYSDQSKDLSQFISEWIQTGTPPEGLESIPLAPFVKYIP